MALRSGSIFFIAFYFLALTAQSQSQIKPNVIIILADDLGYSDVGFNGSKDIPTPNIDRIAAGGVKFTNGYVTYNVCGPSRAGLITGRYQNRFGFARNPIIAPNDPEMGLPLTERTLAKELKTVGYTNAIIGKWHLGAHETLKPSERGFDHFFGFLSGGHNYFPSAYDLEDLSEVKEDWDWYRTKLLKNDQRVEEEEPYLTDALSREASKFILRNPTNPFFLYLAYNAPHGPLQATEKYLNRFEHIQDIRRRTYAAMVSAMDDGVGRVLQALEESGNMENTIIFFLSDNGGPEQHNASDNGPLRAGKGSMFEGGIRVPFAMQWPAQIPKGTVYDSPVMSFDIFATACAYAGVTPQNELDGVNIIPFLRGDRKDYPHQKLFWVNMDKNHFSVRSGNNKLVNEKSSENEIFDLSTDLGEQNPLEATDLRTALLEQYNAWRMKLPAPLFMGLGQREAYKELQDQTPKN